MTDRTEVHRERAFPYTVCDACGRLWTVVTPTKCGTCGSKALWSFPSLEAARDHSRMIQGRA